MRPAWSTLCATVHVLVLAAGVAAAVPKADDSPSAVQAARESARATLLGEARQLTELIDQALVARVAPIEEGAVLDEASLATRVGAYRARALQQMGSDREVVAAVQALDAKLRDHTGATCVTATGVAIP